MSNTEQIYNANASKWLRNEPSSLSDFTARPLVFDSCGDVTGKSVLDIGCGEGYCARELKRRGAGYYLGLDLSKEMIEAARSQEAEDCFGIEYAACNVVDYTPQRRFDLCIAVFLFNYLDVPSMQTVFSMVYESLEPSGKFVFSVPHPFFPFARSEKLPPFFFEGEGKNYFSDVNQQLEGKIWKRSGEPLHVQCVHKTFQDYFSALSIAGFKAMPQVKELTVTQELCDSDPEFFGPLQNVPLHVLFSLSK